MPRRRGRFTRRRRGAYSSHRKRPSKFTVGRIIQGIVSFAPVTASALQATQDSGGFGSANGWLQGALPTVTKAYGFYNTNSHSFDTTGAWEGYPMLVLGYAARRLVSRFWR
jgi:hypothetical protein